MTGRKEVVLNASESWIRVFIFPSNFLKKARERDGPNIFRDQDNFCRIEVEE